MRYRVGTPWHPETAQSHTRDRAAMAQLQARYSALTAGSKLGPGNGWTREEALELGKLYVQAWGALPNTGRLRAQWCLPHSKTILELFGSYGAYWQELREEG